MTSSVSSSASSTLPVPRWLRIALSVSLAAASAGSLAQTRNASTGQQLYDNITDTYTSVTTCATCHTVLSRRQRLSNASTTNAAAGYAALDVSTVETRLQNAINANTGGMGQFRNILNANDVSDLAAYIADTPKVSANALRFTASTATTAPAEQYVDLSVPKTENLTVTSVTISGPDAARFSKQGDLCNGRAFVAGTADCRMTIRFTPTDTQERNATLTLNLRQGSDTTAFTRTVTLNGGVAVTSDSDSGGGALGWGWLAALGLVAGLARRRG